MCQEDFCGKIPVQNVLLNWPYRHPRAHATERGRKARPTQQLRNVGEEKDGLGFITGAGASHSTRFSFGPPRLRIMCRASTRRFPRRGVVTRAPVGCGAVSPDRVPGVAVEIKWQNLPLDLARTNRSDFLPTRQNTVLTIHTVKCTISLNDYDLAGRPSC
jgi:hypothetical protein